MDGQTYWWTDSVETVYPPPPFTQTQFAGGLKTKHFRGEVSDDNPMIIFSLYKTYVVGTH